MYSCINKCLCTRCIKIVKNCAECKHSVKKTKDCLDAGIKKCEFFIEKEKK